MGEQKLGRGGHDGVHFDPRLSEQAEDHSFVLSQDPHVRHTGLRVVSERCRLVRLEQRVITF